VGPIIYFAIVLPQLATMPVADIDYQLPMLATIGLAIALAIAVAILLAIVSPKEAGKADQRDREIGRFGEYVGGTVLGVLTLVPLALTLLEVDWFWIANSLYLALAIAAFIGGVVKLVAYRRGL
jgi:predicted membrane channel-forming protein YqfA (hemolysin III family)